MRAVVVGMMLVALLAFASDRSHGQPNPGQQQQPLGPAQAVVPATKQLDVPAEAERKNAAKEIHDTFKIGGAKSKEKKIELAEKLQKVANEMNEKDEPVLKYVLLEESQQAWIQAGDVDNAVRLLNARGGLFKINMPEAKLELIEDFKKPNGETAKKLVELALKMADEYLEADLVEIAEDSINLANAEKAIDLAIKLADNALKNECKPVKERVNKREIALRDCQTALAALKKNPADQEANSVVGKYYSIDKHDWEKGLPYLIQGTQDSLKDYATTEQTLRKNKVPAANTTKEMFVLAGDWWTLYERVKGKNEKLATGIKNHAGDLYRELLPNLTNAVHQERAKNRVAECNDGGKLPKRRIKLGAIDNSIEMDLVRIPAPGDFLMGKHEITQSQFKQVMKTEPWVAYKDVKVGDACAASCVDWNEATEFCLVLTKRDREQGLLPAGEVYRLPTEKEWEFACRAGTGTTFSFGNIEKDLDDYGWFSGNTAAEQYAHEVVRKKPNPWGLFDMHGNVHEWCSDFPNINPGPAGGAIRVLRGGSWMGDPLNCQSAVRFFSDPMGRRNDLGFRVVRSKAAQ